MEKQVAGPTVLPMIAHRCPEICYLIVLGARIVLEQSEALAVEPPIVSLSLQTWGTKESLIYSEGPPLPIPLRSRVPSWSFPRGEEATDQGVPAGVMDHPAFLHHRAALPLAVLHRLDHPHQRDVVASRGAERQAEPNRSEVSQRGPK